MLKGLLIKECLIVKQYMKTMGILAVFFLVFTVATGSVTMLGSMMGVLCFMLPVVTFSFDEGVKWDTYLLATPVSRKDVVRAKYLFCLLTIGVGTLLPMGLGALLTFAGFVKEEEPIWIVAAAIAAVAALFVTVLLPLIYRFGVEKSRFAMMAIFLLPTVGVLIFKNMKIPMPDWTVLEGLLWYLPAVVLAALYVSYRISLGIYEKKEF